MSTRWQSWLAEELERFVDFKRSLGHAYAANEQMLRNLDRWIGLRKSGTPFQEIARAWLGREPGRKYGTLKVELSIVREFCRFMRREDPDWFVPGRDWSPPKAGQRFIPYIFSVDEVRLLVRKTGTINGPPLRRLTYRTLLYVLYCTGLRFGEALRLKVGDVDLRACTLVASGKGRTRVVPIHRQLGRRLKKYLEMRNAAMHGSLQGTFFIQPNGRPYSAGTAWHTITSLLRRSGLKPAAGRQGPRPYDLRATFAVHRLTRWYRAGVDICARLPLLSAYMGHKDLLGTESYLPATPELLRLASQRLLARLRDQAMSMEKAP